MGHFWLWGNVTSENWCVGEEFFSRTNRKPTQDGEGGEKTTTHVKTLGYEEKKTNGGYTNHNAITKNP